jgi:magnesium transporter
VIVDSAIYVEGRRAAEPRSLQETYEVCREERGVAWIGLYKPTEEEFASVAEEFELHPLAVEDAVKAHQRPKIEHYGQTLFVVLKTARYLDESETVEFGEVHVFVGPNFVVTVRHGEAPVLVEVRKELEGEPELLRRGSMAILYAIMDRVVDDYAPVAEGLEDDIEEIETEVFGGEPDVARRIYDLSREVIQFHRATKPLVGALGRLIEGKENGVDSEVRRYLRDVRDHLLRVVERVEGFRELLNNILSVNLTMVGINQNEEVKKISAWAAILFAPTLVAGIYGMNFEHMPELGWLFGYPFALGLMVLLAVALHLFFKRSGWL